MKDENTKRLKALINLTIGFEEDVGAAAYIRTDGAGGYDVFFEHAEDGGQIREYEHVPLFDRALEDAFLFLARFADDEDGC